jgi:LPXTG-motif cell wall-anchored protein
VASLGLVAVAAGTADAQQTTATTPCSYFVSPVTLPQGGGNVTVTGKGPGDAEVRIFANGVFQVSTHTDNVTGAFSVTFFLAQTSEITVSMDNYPATPCLIDAEAQALVRRGALPRTGGSNIESTVLLGLALLLVGTVLVVAVRRREQVRGRT